VVVLEVGWFLRREVLEGERVGWKGEEGRGGSGEG